MNIRTLLVFAGCLLIAAPTARGAVGTSSILADSNSPGTVALVREGVAAPIAASTNDWPGVLRAVTDFQADVERVSGIKPVLTTSGKPAAGANTVIIGTVGRSELIDGLVASGKLNVDAIRGRWEAFIIETVDHPTPNVERALVIAGSDKRGTTYGVYELSQQIGVSPWYWWADVPVPRRETVLIKPGRLIESGPVVKYRGIFLNDEAPALSGWTREKFGGFNHAFYAHVFELILRLRGNYLWPAMWGNAFADDDPENARLADEYGIVMGTSHHEPLMRAHAEWAKYGRGPWDYSKNDTVLREFWRASVERTKNYENVQSLGMRGDGDEAMSAETNTALLERIVSDQRKILTEVTGKKTTDVPQLWALYKEVQSYYEHGMRVPDDVTLLWCDDNWGNIRRLPTPEERKRPGGAGIYYHFDYVGGPRNYKWLNTIPLTKIQEQMNLAWQHEANRIWIVNVGDLKPMEFPIEFFLTMAWDPARWPADQLDAYSEQWAAREFGPSHAAEIARLLNGYTKLNSRRKPEMLAPETFSIVNYREAERILAEWRDLSLRAEKLNASLPAEQRDAFFQLVLYPLKASANAQELYVAAGLNRLYARQGRSATNAEASRVREFFAEDGRLAAAYHSLGGGKWNHFMDQVKFGYTTWQQPEMETMPAVAEVRSRNGAALALAIEGSETAWPSYGAGRAILPELDNHDRVTRWIEVFNRGKNAFTYQATADQPWITISPDKGSIRDFSRLEIAADWKSVPAGEMTATITVEASTGERLNVQLPIKNRVLPAGTTGFIEQDRHIAIEAPHFSRAVSGNKIDWRILSDFGRTLGGVTAFPVTAAAIKPDNGTARLEYDVSLFSTGDVSVELHCAPSLDFQPGASLQLGVSFDDAPPEIVKLDTWATLQQWERAVGDGVRRITTRHHIAKPGQHVLKLWYVTPGVVFERIIIDAGGVRPSYLGPPESPRIAP